MQTKNVIVLADCSGTFAVTGWLVGCLMSNWTYIRHFGDDYYRLDNQTNIVKALKETSYSSRSDLNLTRTNPPCYCNTSLGNRLCAWCKGLSVTNPICWTSKNCSYKCAAAHNPAQSIVPCNIQTITITRMLFSGVEGGRGITVTAELWYCVDIYSVGQEVLPGATEVLCTVLVRIWCRRTQSTHPGMSSHLILYRYNIILM